MIQILIADDHAIFRQGVRRVIEFAADMRVVSEASNGREVLESIRSQEPDILLLDLAMPSPSGIERIKRVREVAPSLPILVLTVHNESELASRTIRAGAAGYLTKDGEPELLLDAIRTVSKGGNYVAQPIAAKLLYDRFDRDAAPHRLLSDREYQVFLRLARGLGIGVIADDLYISPKTVSTHKFRVLQKLGLKTEAELVRYAIRHQLVD